MAVAYACASMLCSRAVCGGGAGGCGSGRTQGLLASMMCVCVVLLLLLLLLVCVCVCGGGSGVILLHTQHYAMSTLMNHMLAAQ